MSARLTPLLASLLLACDGEQQAEVEAVNASEHGRDAGGQEAGGLAEDPLAPSGLVEPRLCGGTAEACCEAPLPECGLGLNCDAKTRRCLVREGDAGLPILCRTSSDCAGGQSCCVTGLLGTCEPIEPAQCPLADLRLVLPVGTAPNMVVRQAAQCDVAMGCAGAAGPRRILDLSIQPQVLNSGEASVLIGDPQLSPGFERVECGYGPVSYLDDFLHYELIDAAGAAVAVGRGQLTLPCNSETGSGDSSFTGAFIGIAPGLSDTTSCWAAALGCSGLDLAGVAPGGYVLRLTINPEIPGSEYPDRRLLPESDYSNNSLSLRVTVPAYDDPSRACPERPNPLFGFGTGRECGWARVAGSVSCMPDTTVQVGCQTCSPSTQMLRVCHDDAPCSALAALAVSDQSWTACGDDGALHGIDELCIESCCSYHACPLAQFTCPADGSYSVWAAHPSDTSSSTPALCELVPDPRVPPELSCSDGFQNGTETDIDCGGNAPECRRCADSFRCLVDADCDSSTCTGGVCASLSSP